jgi:P-type E1-E2 ATPase
MRDVAIGDIVKLALGRAVAADGPLLPGRQRVQVDESKLTGESLPRTCRPLEMLFMGSVVKSGESVQMATLTGKYTSLGKVSTLTQDSDEEG